MTTPADDREIADDEALPTVDGDLIALHIGHDLMVRGRPVRIYVQRSLHALPGETDLEHQMRAQELLVSAYLNHAAVSEALSKQTLDAIRNEALSKQTNDTHNPKEK
jgi:hypothetical protein